MQKDQPPLYPSIEEKIEIAREKLKESNAFLDSGDGASTMRTIEEYQSICEDIDSMIGEFDLAYEFNRFSIRSTKIRHAIVFRAMIECEVLLVDKMIEVVYHGKSGEKLVAKLFDSTGSMVVENSKKKIVSRVNIAGKTSEQIAIDLVKAGEKL